MMIDHRWVCGWMDHGWMGGWMDQTWAGWMRGYLDFFFFQTNEESERAVAAPLGAFVYFD